MTTPNSSHTAPATATAPAKTAAHRDDGAAMIITMMVIALVGVLATTVLSVTVNNLGSARRAQDSALALDAADAGLTQMVVQLRSKGVRGLPSTLPACTRDGWKTATPMLNQAVPGTSLQRYKTWVALCPTSATDKRTKTLKVTSQGSAGNGVRVVQETVNLVPRLGFPLGVFAKSFQGGGSADFDGISVFSTGCVWERSKIHFTSALDAAYDIPTAVHSSKIITDTNGNTANCSVDKKAIHNPVKCPVEYKYDQDAIGGPCAAGWFPTSPSQYARYYGPHDFDGDGTHDSTGTYIKDDATLLDLYDIEPDPFPQSKLDELKAFAQEQGTYFTSHNGWTVPDPADVSDAIVYFDLQGSSVGKTINLNDFGTTWKQVTDPCPERSLLIVIENGNADMNSNKALAASVVLTSKTYGNIDKANGNAGFVGTIYANTVNTTGSFETSLNQCFLDNLSPFLFSVETSEYVELDR